MRRKNLTSASESRNGAAPLPLTARCVDIALRKCGAGVMSPGQHSDSERRAHIAEPDLPAIRDLLGRSGNRKRRAHVARPHPSRIGDSGAAATHELLAWTLLHLPPRPNG